MSGWRFWIDRGGTFTDIVARAPNGALTTTKLLSDNPERYADAATEGVRRILDAAPGPVPAGQVDAVRMGTTVATNALLERKGQPTVLAITGGFGDALRIGWQSRPELFVRHIKLNDQLYDRVVEVDERLTVDGAVDRPLDEAKTRADLTAAHAAGLRAVAIVLVHGWRFTNHETRVAEIAREVGFTQISVSHEVGALIKLIGRGDTTVADAYLSPVLAAYVDRVGADLGPDVPLLFMQSSGGLTAADAFRGKDAILSGPAGGVVGMAETARQAGFERVIGFDMGGTSTDVSHFSGEYERTSDAVVAGVRLRAPMLSIHTVAAGGGSICRFEGGRMRAGPESAGAVPGPAAYRRGGPLTVTDCNVMLGKLRPEFFPARVRPRGGPAAGRRGGARALRRPVGSGEGRNRPRPRPRRSGRGLRGHRGPEHGRGHQGHLHQPGPRRHRLRPELFRRRGRPARLSGGRRPRHDHGDAAPVRRRAVGLRHGSGRSSRHPPGHRRPAPVARQRPRPGRPRADLDAAARAELTAQGFADTALQTLPRAEIKYAGTDTPLTVTFGPADAMTAAFETAHRRRFGFVAEGKPLVVETLEVEAVAASDQGAGDLAPPPATRRRARRPRPPSAWPAPITTRPSGAASTWTPTPPWTAPPSFWRTPGQRCSSPAGAPRWTPTPI